ncbi:hypothetical protein VP01_1368g1 [Puccinia sorghi]|uniref:Uncharacterized protein n=1 Tax=Puccinia sorghi TaxID=27349 RepID=A0A0L6VLX8_9BASI|nr:hypothetical protein VP01_1368g1 [Puccinia sorghi]
MFDLGSAHRRAVWDRMMLRRVCDEQVRAVRWRWLRGWWLVVAGLRARREMAIVLEREKEVLDLDLVLAHYVSIDDIPVIPQVRSRSGIHRRERILDGSSLTQASFGLAKRASEVKSISWRDRCTTKVAPSSTTSQLPWLPANIVYVLKGPRMNTFPGVHLITLTRQHNFYTKNFERCFCIREILECTFLPLKPITSSGGAKNESSNVFSMQTLKWCARDQQNVLNPSTLIGWEIFTPKSPSFGARRCTASYWRFVLALLWIGLVLKRTDLAPPNFTSSIIISWLTEDFLTLMKDEKVLHCINFTGAVQIPFHITLHYTDQVTKNLSIINPSTLFYMNILNHTFKEIEDLWGHCNILFGFLITKKFKLIKNSIILHLSYDANKHGLNFHHEENNLLGFSTELMKTSCIFLPLFLLHHILIDFSPTTSQFSEFSIFFYQLKNLILGNNVFFIRHAEISVKLLLYSSLSPRVIQPSFFANSLYRMCSDCAKTSTYANRWSLDGTLAEACCISTAGIPQEVQKLVLSGFQLHLKTCRSHYRMARTLSRAVMIFCGKIQGSVGNNNEVLNLKIMGFKYLQWELRSAHWILLHCKDQSMCHMIRAVSVLLCEILMDFFYVLPGAVLCINDKTKLKRRVRLKNRQDQKRKKTYHKTGLQKVKRTREERMSFRKKHLKHREGVLDGCFLTDQPSYISNPKWFIFLRECFQIIKYIFLTHIIRVKLLEYDYCDRIRQERQNLAKCNNHNEACWFCSKNYIILTSWGISGMVILPLGLTKTQLQISLPHPFSLLQPPFINFVGQPSFKEELITSDFCWNLLNPNLFRSTSEKFPINHEELSVFAYKALHELCVKIIWNYNSNAFYNIGKGSGGIKYDQIHDYLINGFQQIHTFKNH